MKGFSFSPGRIQKMVLATVIGAASMSAMAGSSYYDQFGQKAGIKAIVDDGVANVAADNRINAYFAHANIPYLKAALTNQICEALGGPCKYTGPNMNQAHPKSMGVTDAAFNALTEDFMKAMDKHNVPLPAQNHLIKILAPMEKDIVKK